ncbi:MAG TPA: YifB family Mg chelatase-like AAA ATPase [Frankiaceae bacterium]|nr:YifB family Mg chelatase-like AAA ATPase [Frankiaceae bacterium]
MGMACSRCVTLLGVEGHLVEVEADLAGGLPGTTLIGLPDTSLFEARDRVRAAVVNSGWQWPGGRNTIGLFPAALPKSGSGFDAAVAAAVLAAAGVVPREALADRVLLGELALDGRMRPLPGVLPAVLTARRAGITRVVVPAAHVAEASLVPGMTIDAVDSLTGLVALLRGEDPGVTAPPPAPPVEVDRSLDLCDVAGQPRGRLAVEVAAAGGHHLFFEGPPGAGKTMLAERLPGLLPPLTESEALEVTAVHSVAGVLAPGAPLISTPPFRSPHSTASMAAIVGGGSRTLRPGAVSLAHRGVLFLDEAPEFAPNVLDALRQPLESGVVEVARSAASARFPARFTLVLAANPCPCGRAGTKQDASCPCPPKTRIAYRQRLSGPLLDRVDLRVQLEPPSKLEFLDAGRGPRGRHGAESTARVARRVVVARATAAARLTGLPWRSNGEVPGVELRNRWPVSKKAMATALDCFEDGRLSARGLDRVLRVAWTVADLRGRTAPGVAEVATALQLRLPGMA